MKSKIFTNWCFLTDNYSVIFDDGHKYDATRARIRGISNETVEAVGTRVEARFTDGYWYPAQIASLPGIVTIFDYISIQKA